MTDWADVDVGDVVIGARDKKPWEVTSKSPDGTVVIRNADSVYSFTPSGQVERLATADEMRAAAEASVQVTMPGSVVVASQNPLTKVWSCPSVFGDAGSAESHNFIMHEKRSGETERLAILAVHKRWHEENDVAKPHIHTKNFYKDRP